MTQPDKIKDIVLQSHIEFDILAVLLAVIAAIMVAFDITPVPQKTIFSDLATGLFGSTLILSIIALIVNKMLIFKLRYHGSLTSRELWTPTELVESSIVLLFGGVVAWSVDKHPAWITVLLGGEALMLLLSAMVLSSQIWTDVSGVQQQTLIGK